MVSDNKFNGFTKKTITFLRGLEKNNAKEWFDENRDLYDDHLMMPATLYVKEMGEKLKTISPGIVADPRRGKSIFRLNRDVRFGANKKPYKTHLGIYFWDGKGKKLENPGFYFQLDKSKIMFGVGMHIFPREMLNPYRDAVTDPEMGGELKKIITKISKNTDYKSGCDNISITVTPYCNIRNLVQQIKRNGLIFILKTVYFLKPFMNW